MTATREPALAPLRVIFVKGVAADLDTAYRRIFPFDAFTDAIVCPTCGCMKSGDLLDPNTRQECCDDSACLCHDEDVCAGCAHPYDAHNRAGTCGEDACPCGMSELELRYAYGDR
jgi:hypothetical protein